MKIFRYLLIIVMGFPLLARADELTVTMHLLTDQGLAKNIGTIVVADSPFGLLFTPRLSDLSPGIHGFHVHQNPDCASGRVEEKPVPGLAAGGHYDPETTNRHEGPYGQGHLGDLPVFYADQEGKVSLPVLAPRLKSSHLKGRSLMIHAGGDNYSDTPEKLGGGGGRLACGVIKLK